MGEGSERMGHAGSREVARAVPASTSSPTPSAATTGPATVAPEGQRRLLVVEDDATLRESLEMFLGGAAFDVRALPDGRALATTLREFTPDLAILDVDLGAGLPNGFALARQLRERGAVPIIFLTAADGLDQRLSGFEVGADDYITKPFSTSELQARIRAVLRRSEGARGCAVVRHVVTYGDVELDEDARTVTRAGVAIELTRREFDLLLAFLENPERVLSRTQLLSMVWGFEDYDANVVEVYVSTVRRKLEQHGPRIIQTVRGVGYAMRS
jgi:two-component system, OmpR family, response regulator